MPVDFQMIQGQIRQMGEQALPRAQDQADKLNQARECMNTYAQELEQLRQRVELAAIENDSLRCAVPTHEALNLHKPVPALTCEYVLLAADGSQVVPNHHDAVEFGVINVGAYRVQPGRMAAPQEIVRSQLLCHDEVYNRDGMLLSEEIVALMRDIAERRMLADLARQETLPVVTLTDGQLEIFGASKSSRELDEKLEEYIRVLEDMSRLNNVVTAGYVAKPQSDLVVRLLDLMQLDVSELKLAGEKRRFRGIHDVQLWLGLLEPGERSAIFSIQARPGPRRLEGALAPHFFYLNASEGRGANLARVEFPAWVAEDEALVDLLHFAVIGQCRQMGSWPYPYALHRAHEVAVVSLDERSELENMIILELARRGVDVGRMSEKQFAKRLSKRTRWG